MLGAIIGDIVGSPYEYGAEKTKNFRLLSPECRPTDDSVMTIAVGCACVEANCNNETNFKTVLRKKMRELGAQYPDAGYGAFFIGWLESNTDDSYDGYTNGSAMRVSPVGWFFDTLEETERVAKISAEITHNHPEGIKGAQATAAAIFLARTGKTKPEIKEYIETRYRYDLDRTWEYLNRSYGWKSSCQETVPEAIIAFLESDSFEDSIRKAVSMGGDSDTLACITGGIAEAFYNEIPVYMIETTQRVFPPIFHKILNYMQEQTYYAKK